MQLQKKGEIAQIGGIQQFMVTLKWTSAVDFDLAAVYTPKTGADGIVYFGALGDLNQFPYMQLSGDEGVGDVGGEKQEDLRVMDISQMKKIYILCWDYPSVESGQIARFAESDIQVTILDDQGKQFSCALDSNSKGNVCCVAEIDNSSAIGAKFINRSSVGTLNGLHDLSQLIEICQSI